MTKKKLLIITSSISLLGIFISSFLTWYFTSINESRARKYESQLSILTELLKNTTYFSDYNQFVTYFEAGNLEVIKGKHLCDYDTSLQDVADKNGFLSPCVFWDQLQRGKYAFHLATIEARILEPNEVVEILNSIESGFDEIFIKAVNTEYNMWLVPNIYNEVMNPLFIQLENSLRTELNS